MGVALSDNTQISTADTDRWIRDQDRLVCRVTRKIKYCEAVLLSKMPAQVFHYNSNIRQVCSLSTHILMQVKLVK